MPVMRSARRLRRCFVGGLIASWLFVQWATAAYACTLLSGPADGAAAMPADLPCAEMMARGLMADEDAPGLCLEHCKAGTRGLEPAHAPLPLSPAPALGLAIAPAAAVGAWRPIERRRDRGPPPPHSVVYCCWRL
jgi:hypothetical protein